MPHLTKVVGDSMSPTLTGGDYVLTIKPRSIRPGFIYVVNHSDLGRIVKRLERIENSQYFFKGDNPQSTPSAVIGPVAKDRIIGRTILRISKSGLKRLPKK
ncbi:MAG: peptidase S24 [Robiginitomaculum sp.]|nr:MAG: peptidase S24 [Robiginitomaculum sp.]